MKFHNFYKKRVHLKAFLPKAFYLNCGMFADEWVKVPSIDESFEGFRV
jgi:hypothetical protein